MDTRQLRENRAAIAAADLVKYRGQWVAISMDGRRIVAGSPDLVELDALLLALGENRLLADTGDPAVDALLRGYIRVRLAPGRSTMMRIDV